MRVATRRPQNGTQAHAPGRAGGSQAPRPGAALPRFGTAVEPLRGRETRQQSVNH